MLERRTFLNGNPWYACNDSYYGIVIWPQLKLGALAAKMDKNGDGEITQEELTMWIHYNQTKYIYDDTERQWEENDKNGDGQITWDEYKEHTYGFLTEEELNQ